MWKWFSRRPASDPIESAETIRRRLMAAQLLVQKARRSPSTARIKNEDRGDRWGEILPSDGPEAIIPYRPSPSGLSNSVLAAALESILQGQRVSAEIFTQLYRGGFVFKDPQGQWSITALGKELIEKHKLITPEGCLVAGVKCAAGWSGPQSS